MAFIERFKKSSKSYEDWEMDSWLSNNGDNWFCTKADVTNQINEITKRAAADKREVESLSKKYEEKLKQAGESNSRMASEEAAFRDVQERKLELYNAIVRMEQGGNADSLLQVTLVFCSMKF